MHLSQQLLPAVDVLVTHKQEAPCSHVSLEMAVKYPVLFTNIVPHTTGKKLFFCKVQLAAIGSLPSQRSSLQWVSLQWIDGVSSSVSDIITRDNERHHCVNRNTYAGLKLRY